MISSQDGDFYCLYFCLGVFLGDRIGLHWAALYLVVAFYLERITIDCCTASKRPTLSTLQFDLLASSKFLILPPPAHPQSPMSVTKRLLALSCFPMGGGEGAVALFLEKAC